MNPSPRLTQTDLHVLLDIIDEERYDFQRLDREWLAPLYPGPYAQVN